MNRHFFHKLWAGPLLAAVLSCGIASSVTAAIFSGPTQTDHAIDPAIPANDSRFVQWADGIDLAGTRLAPRGSSEIRSDGGIVSLGDLSGEEIAAGELPGQVTVTFPTGIRNGTGADFAVFENGFVFPGEPYLFMELAYVEVSTNGHDFARFPSLSLNKTFEGPFGQSFGGFDSRNVFNLAGKHANGFGTPFDLRDLATNPLVTGGIVDLDDVRYVRLVDIPGSGDFLDSQGNPILDAWLTEGGSGGFDFRLGPGVGVGVIHATAVPEPGMLAFLALGTVGLGIAGRRMTRRDIGRRGIGLPGIGRRGRRS